MKPTNDVFSGFGMTVFEVMSQLAIEHETVNLGQGFPDDNGPADVRARAAEALEDRPNQYPPMMGVPELRQALAAHARRFYGLDVDWRTETMVTSGATEALAACALGLLGPGDEVVLIEPLYDCYYPMTMRAGATPRLVRVEPPHWELPRDELAAAFNDRTKMILLNDPMNPSGKVFTRDELSFVAELCVEHDCYAVCDEAYEHILYDGREHLPLIAFPGMRERAIKIGSAGKTFSLTGWKVGYLTAAAETLEAVSRAHQFLTFTTAPNLQRAGATPRLVRVEPPHWELPRDELAAAFNDRTKMILLNDPMNPSGKVFTRDELSFVAELCVEHDCYAVCDEAYEHILYDGREHLPLIAFPGMRERAIKIGSAGKTFSLTGWKVGYLTAAAETLEAVSRAHQFLTFTTAPNLQRAVAYGLQKDDSYFEALARGLQQRRDFVSRGLGDIGFDVVDCHGTYFINADFRPLGFEGADEEFCRYITVEAGVTAIPVSAFYPSGAVNYLARFCFGKQWPVLERAIDRLKAHFG